MRRRPFCQVSLLPSSHQLRAHIFHSFRGKYTMLERDYSGNANGAAPVGSDTKLLLCSLPSQVQTLLKTICSIAMMKATMTEIG